MFLSAITPQLTERIEVLELATLPREKICAGAVAARAEKLLATIGIKLDVPSVPVDGVSLRFRKGSAVRRVGGIGRVVRRKEFDEALRQQALARGIRISHGVKVLGYSRQTVFGGLSLRVSTSAGERVARVLIGADGVRSAVRSLMGVPKGTLTAQAIEVDTEPVAADLPRDVLHFDFREPGVGYSWDFPTVVDGQPLVCRGVYQLDWQHEPRIDVGQRLEARLDAAGISRTGLRFKRFAVRGLDLHHAMSAPNVLLVGEAAGVDPLLAEGIAQAVASGALAAEYVAERIADDRLDFADWRGFFARSATGLDTLSRVGLVSVFRHPLARRFLEHMTLATPESLDVVTAISAGKPVPARSAVTAGLKAALELLRMPLGFAS